MCYRHKNAMGKFVIFHIKLQYNEISISINLISRY